MWQQLIKALKNGDIRGIARSISLVENEAEGYEQFMKDLPGSSTPIIGITGPPGAGKSTLADALIELLVKQNKKVAVLCVDPSSPFNAGAILGDRIRMAAWYNHPDVFIRSLATRGSLGGLTHKIIEITDILKACSFDYIIVETVGVGQSEIEIAGLADLTVVVMVPEGGDEIQTMKAGLMEVADIFVVNKSDRPGADLFVNNLHAMLGPAFSHHTPPVPVVKTIASQHTGITELMNTIINMLKTDRNNDKKYLLLAEKAWQLIINKRMSNINKSGILEQVKIKSAEKNFSLYRFVETLY
ncbi:MAG TPA: methylmalonyl Co-A mutase-associated GTPase MeaB [Chitinophagaceae bacterium]|nr:methylmalonyl Co-A mutase-associated GTPase MeaB [Chitinophagaceae bacterium]